MNIVLLIFIVPLSLLMHEVGHGIGTILTSKTHHAHIYLGDTGENNKENFRIGRLHFHVQWAFTGWCRWGGELNKRQSFFILIGGPLMTAFIMTTCLLLLRLEIDGWGRTLLVIIAETNFLVLLFTLIPNQLPRWFGPRWSFPSDGLQLLRLLMSK